MNHCPSCGRYVGPQEACPYCGARLTRRIPIHLVKIAALVLATLGLALLWLAAIRAEVVHVTIGQAGATMNMAYIRLQGRCIRTSAYNPESETLSFWIDDGTGQAHVSAYRAETRQIIEEGRVPALGDLVEVDGTLRVREEYLALTVNASEQLKITRADPVERAIGSIAPEDQYLRVRVRGQVREVYEPYQGLTLITIRDGTASIPIAISADLVALSGIPLTLITGQSIEVVAAVSLYGDMPQLVPAVIADILVLDQPVVIGVEKPIGALTSTDVGRLVTVRGTVTRMTPFSSGVKYGLDDTSGAIVVLLWQSVYDALSDPARLDVGAELQVQGELSRYRGALELVPQLAEDVRVFTAAPPSTGATVDALTVGDVGHVVTLCGTLGPLHPFSAGVKFSLDDGTGQIILLLWKNVYDAIPDADRLVAGAQVEVTGRIDEYRGDLEIVPEARDVQVLE